MTLFLSSLVCMQAVELNLDEETLMRLVPFARSSLSKASSDWNKPIFFERFEVNPIMIIASFDPRPSRAEGYSSRQQALRTLLHSVIKIPAVKGTTVKLNGVLLQHALLSYNQLVMKCAQHYSWYAMKAAYVARGVELLPPAFASLFDDSASISIDAFFDPSQGFVDAKNFAMGMFSVLRKGLRLKGFAGTQRYLGELEGTMRQAGSNILYAIITEVSDNILKGAETHGLEGMMRGFRRGLLSVAMRPYVLKNAVVRGSGTKRIQLDKSLGTDEVYVEGYLQAMVDVLFRQEYLRIKVSNDQVILKNLPPNSTLSEEIVGAVRAFLTKEGLLQGQTSAAAANVLRRLRGENEANLARAVFSMSEQLLTILAVRTLKRKILQLFKIQQRQEPELQRQPSFPTESEDSVLVPSTAGQRGGGFRGAARNMILSSVFAYLDGRLCRNIPNPFVRRIVSGLFEPLARRGDQQSEKLGGVEASCDKRWTFAHIE
ncbi:hypothetical protein CBR_g51675 [Chara braunii]|uniref:Uncharacterized protein n=1 Tax=Chara braunii TaxID=69332 RepID=A0A388M8V0_CHABU|nr:hypothetical protein CBR_g51675 [Chara braunii]|eukprot:GBG91017.1 hypothetical protein CBR_g51675 [Chara braunii]